MRGKSLVRAVDVHRRGPVPNPPPNQFTILDVGGWPAIISHFETGPDGWTQNPHFVVDWTKEQTVGEPYPFSPSEVPSWLSDIWLENGKANRPHVKRDIVELKDKHWGMPIFVVGTGPSLDKNMHKLLEIPEDKRIIIATNNAINLLPPELKIDYYMVVDGRLPAEKWWSDCRKDVKVISVPMVTRKLPEYFDEDEIYWARFAGEDGPNKCFKGYDLGHLEPGYVCGFSATNAAFWLGGNPIVWVGMDCCIANGLLHAGDTSPAAMRPGEQFQVELDIFDCPQVTTSTYVRGCWKLAAAAILNGRHRRFVNCTEGGLLGAGRTKGSCSIAPLEEVARWIK
jgi:hypothetical protein